MEITNIKVRQICRNSDALKAFVSITVDGALAVHDIKIIGLRGHLFVAMPSREDGADGFRDIVHPINPETRQEMEKRILEAYFGRLAALLRAPDQPPPLIFKKV